MKLKKKLVVHFFLLPIFITIYTRSIHRPCDPCMPMVTLWSTQKPQLKYTVRDSHIEFYPIFSFDRASFDRYCLPKDFITYTHENSEEKLLTSTLNNLIESVVIEIKNNKKQFTHFTVIKKKNFSFKKQCGLIILAFKNYPFVLKLFMETPRTFFDYHAKGIEPLCFFYMSGGANRHVTGLTRIKNREYLLQKAAQLPEWAGKIEIPRKWFWLPKQPDWLILEGKNIGEYKTITTKIPSIYAIVADFVHIDNHAPDIFKKQSATVIRLSKDLDLFVDAHRDNFVFQKNSDGSYKIIIVDTEHFPSIVGLKEKISFETYFEWYLALIKKCFFDCYLRTKQQSRIMQRHRLAL